MESADLALRGDEISGRGRTVNPFLVLEGAADFIAYAVEVFGAEEVAAARTPTPSGALIHAELRIGDSLVLLSDRLDGWPLRPGLLQVWVRDVEVLIARAVERGAVVVTPPTPFYGEVTLARLQDPWGNLWWAYAPAPGQSDPIPAWEGGSDVVFRTVDAWMRSQEEPRR